MAPSELRQLLTLLTASVDAIEEVYEKNGSAKMPSLDAPYDPTADPLAMTPEVMRNSALAISAAAQMIATLKNPAGAIMDGALIVRIWRPLCQ